MTLPNLLRRPLAGLLLASTLLMGAGQAWADDTDIYIDTTLLPLQAPLTALALDLNVTNPNTVLCDNILLGTSPNCLDLQSRISIGDLASLLGVSLPSAVVPIVGGLDPATLISDLSSSVRTLLGSALGLVGALPLSNGAAYVLAIQQILSALVDSRVTILLNHANRGPGAGVCAFADLSSLPQPRQSTVGCSNGAYLFTGLTNLADPLQLVALLGRVVGALLPSVTSLNPPNILSSNHPYQTKEIYAELAKYLRGDDIYNGHLGVFDYGDTNATNNLDTTFPLLSWDTNAELPSRTKYKSGLANFPQACTISLVHLQLTNAAGENDSDAELKALFPDADSNGDGTLTQAELVLGAQDSGFVYGADDRRRIQSRFIVQENLFTSGDLSQLDQIRNLGGNVTTYTNVLGLLGRGRAIASSLLKPLSVDASLTSLAVASSRTNASGVLTSAYLPQFRADPDQKPSWVGNLKRLKLRTRLNANGLDTGQFDVVDARDTGSGTVSLALNSDGRIRSSALTVWTDSTKLGTNVINDGGVTDLGGAGQKIPGYAFNGGGNPGRGNGTAARNLYYDSRLGTGGVLCADLATCGNLNPDDSGVRAELIAATGATAFVAPVSPCVTACNTTSAACGLLCGSNQTLCGTGCTTSALSCNLSCGLLGGASCANACTTAQNNCNTGCSNTAATCNSNCTNTLNSCINACGTSASSRDADTVNRELLLHARGFDVGTKSVPKGTGPGTSPTNTGVTGRKWMLGAVLHSRPVAINYGKRGGSTTDVVRVVYGSADGILHMVDDSTGVEQWGFMPQAVMGNLGVLRENSSGSALPYGVDGSPIVLIRDRPSSTGVSGVIGDVTGTDGDRVLLFFGLRRGGAAYYALDITDPAAPKLVWRITPAGLLRAGQTTVDAGTAALYAPLALAFSTPQVGRVRVDLDENLTTTADQALHTVLLFGGGYNGGRNNVGTRLGKDANTSKTIDNPLTTVDERVGLDDGTGSSDKGTALYMIDAATGQLLWRSVRGAVGYNASTRTYSHPLMVDSFASDVTAVDSDNDTLTDRLYVGDTGGRLWRADFAGVLASTWTVTPVASVGRHNTGKTNSFADDRRIFFAPDYVPLRNTVGSEGSDVVLFGTGDREDVLNLTTVNSFYAFRDTDLVSGKAASEILTTEASIPQHTAFTNAPAGTLVDVTAQPTGYRFSFTRSGEKLFSSPVTLNASSAQFNGGVTTFTSYIPPDPTLPTARICTPSEGVSRLFSFGVRKGQFFNVNGSSPGRDVPLSTGLPGEVNALAGTNQAAGGKIFSLPARTTYRASWSERLGETQK